MIGAANQADHLVARVDEQARQPHRNLSVRSCDRHDHPPDVTRVPLVPFVA
jgi:hypothetical protein